MKNITYNNRLEWGGKSPAQLLHEKRGRAPRGMRWTSASVYFPAGKDYNVRGTYPRNPKIAAQITAMFDAWYAKKFGKETTA